MSRRLITCPVCNTDQYVYRDALAVHQIDMCKCPGSGALVSKYTGNVTQAQSIKNWTFLGEGRHRQVYYHNGFVVKIPIGDMGLGSNEAEARRYKNAFGLDKSRMARCSLLPNGWLVMLWVNTQSRQPLPKWSMAVDCQQVGWSKKGQPLAYDSGL